MKKPVKDIKPKKDFFESAGDGLDSVLKSVEDGFTSLLHSAGNGIKSLQETARKK